MCRQATTLVLILVLLAGCSTASPGDTATPTPEPTATPPPTSTATPTASPTPTESPTPSPIPVDKDNPWEKRTLTVAITDESSLDINLTSQIRNATQYWEANAEEYADHPIQFEVKPNATSADLEIVIVDEIEQCGLEDDHETRTLGCAPVPTDSPPVSNDVELIADMLPRDFEAVTKHELGHTLGLTHDDEPADVMNESYDAQVIERVYRYTTDIDTAYHIGGTKDQIEAGLGFIEDSANGTIRTNVEFREVDDTAKADFVIRVSGDEGECGDRLDCADYEASPTVITTANLKQSYVGYIVSFYAWNEVAVDVGATERPWELQSGTVDPSKSWWR